MLPHRRAARRSLLLGLALLAALPACSRNPETSRAAPAATRQDTEGSLHAATADGASGDEVARLTAGNRAFAFALFARLAARHSQENLALSPFGVSAALAPTYLGARGQTAEEFGQALQYGIPAEKTPAAFSALHRDLTARNKGDVRLSLASGLWARKQAGLREDFQATVANSGTAVGELDFAGDLPGACRAINDWVADKTDKAILEIVTPEAVPGDTTLVVATAVHLRGAWESPFKASRTVLESFRAPGPRRTVPMMTQTLLARAVAADGAKVVELPLQGGGLVTDFILPDERTVLPAFESGSFTAIHFDRWVAAMKEQRVRVQVPRFRIETRADLGPPLRDLGLFNAFAPAADFSGLSPEKGLGLSRVLQRALVKVDEAGVAASAATAAIAGPRSLTAGPEFEFVADRPFLFIIRDPKTSTVLFLGHVNQPESAP